MSSLRVLCLNPCCGGRCSSTLLKLVEKFKVKSLNPCCGGRCSSTAKKAGKNLEIQSLNPCCGGRCSSTGVTNSSNWYISVLILVVVEDVLVPPKERGYYKDDMMS